MRTVHVVSITDDGARVVLADSAGEHFTLAVDERLRAVLRGDGMRAATASPPAHRELGPREIQTRVRAGATASDLAEESGVAEARIMRFAAPVLDERAHVATLARSALVRDDGMLELGTVAAVTDRTLSSRGVEQEPRWDAWRREDGRWLAACYWHVDGSERTALWALDASHTSATPIDEEARALAGLVDLTAAPPARLAVVPRPDDEPSATDAHDSAGDRDTDSAGSDAEGDPDSGVDGDAPAGTHVLDGSADGDRGSVSVDDTPTGPIPTAMEERAPGTPGPAHPAHRARRRRDAAAGGGVSDPDEDTLLRLSDIADHVEEEPAGRARMPRTARQPRPAVPSWDEIMFGRRS